MGCNSGEGRGDYNYNRGTYYNCCGDYNDYDNCSYPTYYNDYDLGEQCDLGSTHHDLSRHKLGDEPICDNHC